jgi:hypothetical protein
MRAFFLIIIFVVLVAIGPLATLWSVNTLFPTLEIPYTFSTWLAIVILGLFFRGNVSVNK